MFLSSFLLLQGSGALRQPVSCTSFFVTVQSLTVTSKNPFQIGFADGIFAFRPMFYYGQRSKCADLLNSYKESIKRPPEPSDPGGIVQMTRLILLLCSCNIHDNAVKSTCIFDPSVGIDHNHISILFPAVVSVCCLLSGY